MKTVDSRIRMTLPTIALLMTSLAPGGVAAAGPQTTPVDSVLTGHATVQRTFPPTEVYGSRSSQGYVTQGASTGTKTDTPLLQTPMTVEVLPRQVLDERGLRNSGLSSALSLVGVQSLGMPDAGDATIFRGFLSWTTLWNGFRIEDATPGISYANGGAWMSNIERVEVLKGPSSILFGRSEPGGAVHLLTRKPQDKIHADVGLGAGSWSDRSVSADVTGPLTRDGSLLFRLNAAGEQGDSWFRYGPRSSSRGFAPALAWRVAPRTRVSFEGQYRRYEGGENAQQYMPIDPATGRALAIDPAQTLLPGNLSKYRQSRSAIVFDQQWSADWFTSLRFLRNDANNPRSRNVLAGSGFTFPITDGALPASLWVFENQNRQRTDAAVLDVVGHLSALGANHTVLFGADDYRKQFDQAGGTDWAQTTDFYHPSVPEAVAYTDHWSIGTRELALYLQDQFEFGHGWHALLGARYQQFDEHIVADTPSMSWTEPLDMGVDGNFLLPRAALLWQFRPAASVYYSYEENSGSTNGLDYTGTPLAPESARQHEAGTRAEWLDGRLAASLALFELTKHNIASADLEHPGFNIGVGEVESRGLELNVQGAPLPQWNVLVHIERARPIVITGATGALALQSQNLVAGQLLPYVSTRTASLWTSYHPTRGAFADFTVGGGATWASAPNVLEPATIPTSAHHLVSAFATYDRNWRGLDCSLQLNVDNVTDEQYLLYQADTGALGGNTVAGTWVTPRQVRMELRTKW